MTKLLNALKVSLLAVILSFGLSYALAWTAPTTNPPNGNVAAPLNTGTTDQIKNGGLGVTNFIADTVIVSGVLKVGGTIAVCDASNAGAIRYTGADFEGCLNNKWRTLTYSPSPWLVNNLHTEEQCSAAGGVVTDVGGVNVCRVSSGSCPVGWTKYNNWTTTNGNSLNYLNETVSGICTSFSSQVCGTSSATCSVSGHAWADIAQESTACSGTQVSRKRISGSSCFTESCSGATNATVTAPITEIGCF